MKDKSLVAINGATLTRRDMMSAVDDVIVNLNKSGDLEIATQAASDLEEFGNTTGHAKARLWWGMSNWYSTQGKDESFSQYLSSSIGVEKITVDRYVNVIEQIEKENIPKRLQNRPLRDLVPISIMLRQGYEPTKEDWKKIELASNASDLGNILNEITGKKTRKSKRDNVMEEDGSIYTWKNGKRKYVGFLDVVEAKTDPDVAEAIDQIIAGRPITRR